MPCSLPMRRSSEIQPEDSIPAFQMRETSIILRHETGEPVDGATIQDADQTSIGARRK